jgi:N6-adenosine-specific RNA methylase IME4
MPDGDARKADAPGEGRTEARHREKARARPQADCVRERIERLVEGAYLELFAREANPGWDCWGDETGLFDIGTAETRRHPSRLIITPP